ncbi:hypothetical protein J6590_005685 [Homalodisca vitripennis]|nr:hypothetical protein J6590_005685 [Homalodisca vitripennis]
MYLTRMERIMNKSDKPSPVRKQLNFFSDVKLSSGEEQTGPRRAVTPDSDQILANRYGLSFGDINLKEHLSNGSNVIEESSVHLGDLQDTDIVEGNKENCPETSVENKPDDVENKAEIISSDQSSQTDALPLQNTKLAQKTTAPSVTKKPPPFVKSLGGSASKAVTLTPLAVNKSVPGVSVRKTVPLSPTSSAPPRSVIPGRNVAAAAFVPGKKPLTICQTKNNPVTSKTGCNSLSKPQNSASTTEKIAVLTQENNVAVDTNRLAEQITLEKVKEDDSCKRSSEGTITDKSNDSVKEVQKCSNSKEKVDCTAKEEVEKSVKKNSITKDIINEEERENSNKIIETSVKEHYKDVTDTEKKGSKSTLNNVIELVHVNSSQLKSSKNNEDEGTNKASIVNNGKLFTSESNLEDSTKIDTIKDVVEKTTAVVNEKVLKPEKCDKNVMTDILSAPCSQPSVVKQSVSKVTSFVRNKTVPNFVRKSNETLSTSDSAVDPVKTLRSSAISAAKTLPVRKQPHVSDNVNEKPAYAAVSKIYRSNTAIELRPSRSGFSRNVSSAPKSMTTGRQMSSLQKGRVSLVKNQTLVKNFSGVFKSEQNLKKKNSIDEDGWETVKGRNRWRLSQSSGNIKARTMTASSRFYLPSPATSLPALALATEETETDPKPAKLHKDKQNQEIAKANRTTLRNTKADVVVKTAVKPDPVKKSKSKEEIGDRKLKTFVNDRKRISNIRLKSSTLKRQPEETEKSKSSDNK